MMRNAAERILGFPMSNDKQAALIPKLGGLGLRKTTEHADFAYGASWHESQWQAKETWVRPNQVPESHISQSAASFRFDTNARSAGFGSPFRTRAAALAPRRAAARGCLCHCGPL